MKKTGIINPITKEEILRAEITDITFWDKPWAKLTLEEKALVLSFLNVGFLNDKIEPFVKAKYEFYQTLMNITK